MNRVLQDLVNLLDLEALEVNMFRGQSRDLGGKSVFGGQVIGQALVAAARTVEGAEPHSLHAYFLRPGDMNLPLVYEVDRIRDGRSFSARQVSAIQHGQPILSMIASFQKPESGPEHQAPMPQVPAPETLRPQAELAEEWLRQRADVPPRLKDAMLRVLAIEFRPVTPWNPLQPEARECAQNIWFRAAGRLPDDPLLHRCVLAYASDFNLLSTALRPHAMSFLDPNNAIASIDHALWFHRDVRADDWLLYAMDSPSAQGARGLSRGLIFDRGGRLVASVVQENLMRRINPA
ncbi:MAG: acyl-CoA thioesterase II [Nevskia sp.]|nr:acyl-CoA thioesterase II [Nevskia sp.]